MVTLEFHSESAEHVFDEVLALVPAHRDEVHHYKIPISADREHYLCAFANGSLLVFTARLETSELVGYAVFNLKNSSQYDLIKAMNELIYLKPEYRGQYGAAFIKWCDNELKNFGVDIVYQFTRTTHNFGAVLERIGYEHVENIYSRRLA